MKQALFYAIGSAKIQDGILRGVSVVTRGEARGHKLLVDDESLKTFLSAAQSRAGGVPVKMDHGGGFAQIVGKLDTFRIEGDSLRADLHLLKNHDDYSRIVEMAETMSESFGLSASFEYSPEKIDGLNRPRCTEIHSVDLVDEPAANPSGLFESVDSPSKGMTFENFFSKFRGAVVETENAELSTARTEVATLSAKVTKYEADLKAATDATTKLQADLKAKEDELAKVPALIKDEVAKETVKVMASFGRAPIESKLSESPSEPARPDLPKLSPRERVIAAFKAQSAAKANLQAK